MLAEVTLAARNGERHDDAIAFLDTTDLRTGVDHLTHKFVTKNITGLQGGDVAVIKMEIGAADGRAGNAHNSIAWIENFGVVDTLDVNLVFSLPTKRFH